MQQFSINFLCLLSAVAMLVIPVSTPKAEARPLYLKQFITKYPNLAEAAKTEKCNFCHPNDKKMRLDYGQAVEAGIGVKNQKNVNLIDAALSNAEKAKGKDGKTFGEMIKNGNLPE